MASIHGLHKLFHHFLSMSEMYHEDLSNEKQIAGEIFVMGWDISMSFTLNCKWCRNCVCINVY